MGVTSPSTGTCGSHPSQMGVTASVEKIPAGIICRGCMGPLCYALKWNSTACLFPIITRGIQKFSIKESFRKLFKVSHFYLGFLSNKKF